MRIKQLIKDMLFWLSAKSGKKETSSTSDVELVECSSENIEYIASSNNIIVYSIGSVKYYFKECRCHIPIHDYLLLVVNEYFSTVRSNDLHIKKIILSDLEDPKNFKLFSSLFDYSAAHYDIIRHYNGWDTGSVGLPTLFKNKNDTITADWLMQVFPKFVEYIRNEIDAFNLNKYNKIGQYQTFRASLSIATRKLAVLFGIGEMIPKTKYIKLKIDNREEKFGIVTKHVEGVSPLDIEDRKLSVCPELQRQLNILHLFDVICFQRDHSLQNYFVVLDENNKAKSVIAYDNDSPQAFYPLPIVVFSSSLRCSPIIYKGYINRPYIDDGFVQNILGVTSESVRDELSGILTKMQINMLVRRIKKVKKAIKRTKKKFPERFISFEQWNDAAISSEIDGKWGKTYLMHYMNNDEQDIVMEIMNG